jgi:hypothetical protein
MTVFFLYNLLNTNHIAPAWFEEIGDYGPELLVTGSFDHGFPCLSSYNPAHGVFGNLESPAYLSNPAPRLIHRQNGLFGLI